MKHKKTRVITIPEQTIEMTFQEYIGRRIKTRRLELALSQLDVSRMCDISKTFLSEIENGKAGIGFEKMHYLAIALRRDINWFTQGW